MTEELVVLEMPRMFEFKSPDGTIFLDDPNPDMDIPEVLEFYSGMYPSILNSVYETQTVNDTIVYKIKPLAGSLG